MVHSRDSISPLEYMYTAAASQYAPKPSAASTGAMGKKITEGAPAMAWVATLITATATATRLSMRREKMRKMAVTAVAAYAQYSIVSWFSSDGSA